MIELCLTSDIHDFHPSELKILIFKTELQLYKRSHKKMVRKTNENYSMANETAGRAYPAGEIPELALVFMRKFEVNVLQKLHIKMKERVCLLQD